jgi:hypothetical protein
MEEPTTGISLDLRRLFCFVAVADPVGPSHPAARIGVSPQAMSGQVRPLEEEVGEPPSFPTTAEAVRIDVGAAA